MNEGPVLFAQLKLNDGRDVEVAQPIDGLTETVLLAYENSVIALENENDQLAQIVEDTTTFLLTDPVEAKIFSMKALKMSTHPKLTEQQRLAFAMVGAAMSILSKSV